MSNINQINPNFFQENLNQNGSLFQLFSSYFQRKIYFKDQNKFQEALNNVGIVIDNFIQDLSDQNSKNQAFISFFNLNNEDFEQNKVKYSDSNSPNIHSSLWLIDQITLSYFVGILSKKEFQEKFFEQNLNQDNYLFRLCLFFAKDIANKSNYQNQDLIQKFSDNFGKIIDFFIASIVFDEEIFDKKNNETKIINAEIFRNQSFLRFYNLNNKILIQEQIQYIEQNNLFSVNREGVSFDQQKSDYFLIKRMVSVCYLFLGDINLIENFLSNPIRERKGLFQNVILKEDLKINEIDSFIESFYFFYTSENFKDHFVNFRFKDFEKWDESLKEFLKSYIANSIFFGYESFFKEEMRIGNYGPYQDGYKESFVNFLSLIWAQIAFKKNQESIDSKNFQVKDQEKKYFTRVFHNTKYKNDILEEKLGLSKDTSKFTLKRYQHRSKLKEDTSFTLLDNKNQILERYEPIVDQQEKSNNLIVNEKKDSDKKEFIKEQGHREEFVQLNEQLDKKQGLNSIIVNQSNFSVKKAQEQKPERPLMSDFFKKLQVLNSQVKQKTEIINSKPDDRDNNKSFNLNDPGTFRILKRKNSEPNKVPEKNSINNPVNQKQINNNQSNCNKSQNIEQKSLKKFLKNSENNNKKHFNQIVNEKKEDQKKNLLVILKNDINEIPEIKLSNKQNKFKNISNKLNLSNKFNLLDSISEENEQTENQPVNIINSEENEQTRIQPNKKLEFSLFLENDNKNQNSNLENCNQDQKIIQVLIDNKSTDFRSNDNNQDQENQTIIENKNKKKQKIKNEKSDNKKKTNNKDNKKKQDDDITLLDTAINERKKQEENLKKQEEQEKQNKIKEYKVFFQEEMKKTYKTKDVILLFNELFFDQISEKSKNKINEFLENFIIFDKVNDKEYKEDFIKKFSNYLEFASKKENFEKIILHLRSCFLTAANDPLIKEYLIFLKFLNLEKIKYSKLKKDKNNLNKSMRDVGFFSNEEIYNDKFEFFNHILNYIFHEIFSDKSPLIKFQEDNLDCRILLMEKFYLESNLFFVQIFFKKLQEKQYNLENYKELKLNLLKKFLDSDESKELKKNFFELIKELNGSFFSKKYIENTINLILQNNLKNEKLHIELHKIVDVTLFEKINLFNLIIYYFLINKDNINLALINKINESFNSINSESSYKVFLKERFKEILLGKKTIGNLIIILKTFLSIIDYEREIKNKVKFDEKILQFLKQSVRGIENLEKFQGDKKEFIEANKEKIEKFIEFFLIICYEVNLTEYACSFFYDFEKVEVKSNEVEFCIINEIDSEIFLKEKIQIFLKNKFVIFYNDQILKEDLNEDQILKENNDFFKIFTFMKYFNYFKKNYYDDKLLDFFKFEDDSNSYLLAKKNSKRKFFFEDLWISMIDKKSSLNSFFNLVSLRNLTEAQIQKLDIFLKIFRGEIHESMKEADFNKIFLENSLNPDQFKKENINQANLLDLNFFTKEQVEKISDMIEANSSVSPNTTIKFRDLKKLGLLSEEESFLFDQIVELNQNASFLNTKICINKVTSFFSSLRNTLGDNIQK